MTTDYWDQETTELRISQMKIFYSEFHFELQHLFPSSTYILFLFRKTPISFLLGLQLLAINDKASISFSISFGRPTLGKSWANHVIYWFDTG